MMFTAVKGEEVGDAVIDAPDTLELGDVIPASACDIVLFNADLKHQHWERHQISDLIRCSR